MMQYYNVFIFTAQLKEYADPIIDMLAKPFSGRYYRDKILHYIIQVTA
jgi:TFIIF-interacting CTD phosphatase-like protein